MDDIASLFLILLVLSGFYLILGALCLAIEHLSRAAARPRRARTQSAPRRTRTVRPRRRRDSGDQGAIPMPLAR